MNVTSCSQNRDLEPYSIFLEQASFLLNRKMKNSKLEYSSEEWKKIHKCKTAAVHSKGLQQRYRATFLIIAMVYLKCEEK